MKFALMVMAPLLAFGQGTDLPGPIGALPDSGGSPTKVCSWNSAISQCAGIVATSGLSGAFTLTAGTVISSAGYWDFDHGIQANGHIIPAGNLSTNLGGCQTSATCPSGFAAAHEFLGVHAQNIYNYGPNPLTLYSDTGLIAIDTFSAQPIFFYTSNALRAQIDSLGTWAVANLGGSGTRCTHVSNVGAFSITGADCIDPTVPNTFTATQTFSKTPVAVIINGEFQPTLGGGGLPVNNIGDSTNGFLGAFVQNIYNYSSSPFTLFSNSTSIVVDAFAAQPIQFYTNNTLRGQFLSTGTFELNSLAGSGTRCVQVNNSGDLAVAAGGCSSGGVTSIATFSTNAKVNGGLSQFAGGVRTLSHGLTNVDTIVCTILNLGTFNNDGCQVTNISGGNASFAVTSGGSTGAFFLWFALGN